MERWFQASNLRYNRSPTAGVSTTVKTHIDLASHVLRHEVVRSDLVNTYVLFFLFGRLSVVFAGDESVHFCPHISLQRFLLCH